MSLSRKKEFFSVITADLQDDSPYNTTCGINWGLGCFEEQVAHSSDVQGRNYRVEDLWTLKDADKFVGFLLRDQEANLMIYI